MSETTRQSESRWVRRGVGTSRGPEMRDSKPEPSARRRLSSILQNNMSQAPTATTSSSNYQSIFDNAIQAYKKKTNKDLRTHPLLDKLQNCHSPDAILNILYQQIPGFDQSCGTNDKLTKWLDPTVNILCTFSGVIGGGIGLASPKNFRVNVVPDLIFDCHTGFATSCGGLHGNWRPSLSEYFFFRPTYSRAYRGAELS